MKKKLSRIISKSKSKTKKSSQKDFLQASVGDKIIVSKTGNILIK